MKKYAILIKIFSFILVLGMLSNLTIGTVLAQTDQQANTSAAISTAELQLNCQFPIIRAPSGQTFVYYIELDYSGNTPAVFNLNATAPTKWSATILREDESIEVPQIELTPNKLVPDVIRVVLSPPMYEYPVPGEYQITLQANSSDIQQTLNLTAMVADFYGFNFNTANGELYANAIRGEDNHVSLKLYNSGTAPIQNINFSSPGKPTGWDVSFTPESIASLDAGSTKEIDMLIIPSDQIKPGDYNITAQANLVQEVSDSLVTTQYTSSSLVNSIDIRITVLSTTIALGWIAALIVVVVVAVVVFIFRRAHIW